jgi:hypothetical protein
VQGGGNLRSQFRPGRPLPCEGGEERGLEKLGAERGGAEGAEGARSKERDGGAGAGRGAKSREGGEDGEKSRDGGAERY